MQTMLAMRRRGTAIGWPLIGILVVLVPAPVVLADEPAPTAKKPAPAEPAPAQRTPEAPAKDVKIDKPAATQEKPTAVDSKVDKILTNLEKRREGLDDIRCKVDYVVDDQINFAKWEKQGEVLFMLAEPNPCFLIRFDKTVSDGQLGKREWYLFDGTWLHEAMERRHRVISREVAGEGEKVDLFDIDSSPFPMPFGEQKAKILRHFKVKLGKPAKDLPTADHLVCIPRTDSRLSSHYDKLEFFIDREVHLPLRTVMTKNSGQEIITADFPGLSKKSINTGLTRKAFEPPEEWREYDRIREFLADKADDKQGGGTGG